MSDSSSDHGPGALGAAATWGAMRAAFRYLWSGNRRQRALLSRPSESAFRAWIGMFQLGLIAVLLGVVGAIAFDTTLARALGGFSAGLGGFILVMAFVGAAAMEAMVPVPHRVMPADPDDPFRPHDVHVPLTRVADGVWVAQQPMTYLGLSVGARMTVLDTGAGLLVYSPIELRDDLREAVDALGTVRWFVSPNTLHHLFVEAWAKAYPEAELWAAPLLAQKRSDIPWTGTLEGPESVSWDGPVVDVAVMDGHPHHREVVVLHRPSGTLVVADMVGNFGQDAASYARSQAVGLRLLTMWQRPTPPLEWKLSVSDRQALQRSVERIRNWSFERIVVAHGPIIRSEAESVFADAFAFVR